MAYGTASFYAGPRNNAPQLVRNSRKLRSQFFRPCLEVRGLLSCFVT